MLIAADRGLALPSRRNRLSATRAASYVFAAVALGFLLAMLVLFVWQSLPVWRHEGAGYLTGTRWFFRGDEFGAAAMIYGTAAVSAVALVLAAPLGMGAAVFTAEFLPDRCGSSSRLLIELLAGVPSVVYGLLGILFLRDWVYDVLATVRPA